MLKHMTDEQKFQLSAKLCQEVTTIHVQYSGTTGTENHSYIIECFVRVVKMILCAASDLWTVPWVWMAIPL